jgi:peptidoglycan/xylan/chitin deacetylase (PgdA/CDA1 family)
MKRMRLKSLGKNIFFFIAQIFFINLLFRWLNRHKLLIVRYHGITDQQDPPGIENHDRKHISLEKFDRHIAYLTKYYRVIALDEAISWIKSGKRLKPYSAAVTFDDGYKNNYWYAYPILKKYNCPATIYLTTDLIGSNKIFWIDELEYLINHTRQTEVVLTPGQSFYLHTLQDKLKGLKSITKFLLHQPTEIRHKTIASLKDQLMVYPVAHSRDYQFLDWDEIREMMASGLIRIGSHTCSHPMLTEISFSEQTDEIRNAKAKLEEILGITVKSFCYPYGVYDNRIKELVRESSYSYAVSSEIGLNKLDDKDTDFYALKRVPLAEEDNYFVMRATFSGLRALLIRFLLKN